ncbi:hypothetical protein FDECE_7078 [Fusarium decemcellulare]|nr:hypothetical protein FDECE_7078 [Fusarium decemcellulare]
MSTAQAIPRIHLLCMYALFGEAFEKAIGEHAPELKSTLQVSIHHSSLFELSSSIKFDVVVSPANSYGQLDGGFDDAISRAFSPTKDYPALTKVAQEKLYDEWRGFAPPGTCTMVRIPDDFVLKSKNVWGTKYLALCPTMRLPMDVRWDREIVYDTIWSLLCAIDKHNRTVANDKISSILMTPMATGTGFVSPERWAKQTVLALKHFSEALNKPNKWGSMGWSEILDVGREVEETWQEKMITSEGSDTGSE